MKQIDTRGHPCPTPLIMAKKGLDEINGGDEFAIMTDNETSFNNLMSYLKDAGANPTSKQLRESYLISGKKALVDKNVDVEAYCEVPGQPSNKYVVAIKSQKMGEGSDELGAILMRGFINALTEADVKPTHIVLYNSGVNLTAEGTDTADTLQKLEDIGVTVLVCGTCVDYYQLKGKIKVGMVSNMYQITNILAKTGHIVYP